MTGSDSGSLGASARYFTVSDPQQARLLSDPRFQDAFFPFLARELGASAAAAELGLDLNAMLYRIRVLSKAGLLQVVRFEQRKGRPIKIYRSVHDAYFVPYEATPFADLEERLWRQQLPELRERTSIQARRLRAGGIYGQNLFRNELGETWVQSGVSGGEELAWLDPQRTASIDYRTDLLLTDAESREVQSALYELLQRHRPDSASIPHGSAVPVDRQRFRLSVALLPLDE